MNSSCLQIILAGSSFYRKIKMSLAENCRIFYSLFIENTIIRTILGILLADIMVAYFCKR